jgi:hypothetical protein
MPLTPDTVRGIYHAPTGSLRGNLQPQSYNRKILKISFAGLPQGVTFALYRGYVVDASNLMTTTLIGSRNSYDAGRGSAPIELFAGEPATFVWEGSAITAASLATASVVSQWGVD